MDLKIRLGTQTDMGSVMKLIKELADFEKEADAVEITEQDLIEDGFSAQPSFRVFVAELESEIVGIALFYERFSTWKGKAIHLEDLIVRDKHRAIGIGKLLYAKVMEYAFNNNYKRVAWEVLDWNKPAIDFYEKSGAKVLYDWNVVQMDEKSLNKFVSEIKS